MSIESSPKWAATLPDRLLKNSRVIGHRNQFCELLPRGKTICEIGVALGDFTELMLTNLKPCKFYAIDIFVLHHVPDMWAGRVGTTLNGKDHLDFYSDRFFDDKSRGILEILKGDSLDGISKIPDFSIDIAYVDANHSYDSVTAELDLLRSKMSSDGYIIMNDYLMEDWLTHTPYGVVQATNEFMIRENWELIYFALEGGMFCDVAIKKCRE